MVEDIVRTEDEDLQALVEMLQHEQDSFVVSSVLDTQHRLSVGTILDDDYIEDLPDSDLLDLFDIQKDSAPSNRVQDSTQQSMDISDG
jgi:hypothetical protein